jgi:aspartyl-tRNA(Asn)/glutamyl-tRNA(Gln) amidotransferase subunit B
MAERITSILDKYPDYEATIGMEVHVQLTTNTKIFCSCPNTVAQDPNSNICSICAGYPGTMPMLNKKVVDYAILAGLGTHSTINEKSTFDRKHYFYPDLPKNFQITQQAEPICTDGYVTIRLDDGTTKNINLIRIHIEEDAGKNIHSTYSNESFVDLNRAGTPLLEIVSLPEISTSDEVRRYLKALRSIVQYLGICTGNMEEGSFRADTNISVRKKGEKELGTKCELKNINSFKFIVDATEHELERQITILEAGGKVRSETRLWDSKERTTIMMRSKEETADYRFMQEPDLPIIHISSERLAQAKKSMPELPLAKFERFTKELGLADYEADILIEDIDLAHYFDAAYKHTNSKNLINWILRDLVGYLKEEKVEIAQCKVTPERLAQLVDLVDQGIINTPTGKEVLLLIAQHDQNPMSIIEEKGLKQIGSVDELESMVKEIIATNPKQVEEYRSGKEKLFGFFVGQMMQKTKGKGNTQLINDLVKKHLHS